MTSHRQFHKEVEPNIITVTEENKMYLNPGDYTPYKLGSKLERNYLKEVQRYMARERKRKEEKRDRKTQ